MKYVEASGNKIWMCLSKNEGIKVAEIDKEGNVELLPKGYLKGKNVTQIHNINDLRLIAFVHNDKNFYLINKKTDNIIYISNPTGESIYNSIARTEDILIVRDLNNLIFFNCITLRVEYFERVPFKDYVL